MAESEGQEKSEEPTGKRIQDARNKGQIARSKEMGTAAVLISSAISLLLFSKELAGNFQLAMIKAFEVSREQLLDPNYMFQIFGIFGEAVSEPLLYIFSVILAASFIGNILLGGYNFSWQAAQPKFSKMNPLTGLKRLVGLQAWVELFKSLLKFALVAGTAWWLLDSLFEEILFLSIEGMPSNISHSASMLLWMFLALSCSLIIIVLIDAPYQKWHHHEQLKMTKQEVKDEHKNAEGSPETKGRIRRAQREAAQRRMMQEVPTADVVITNPIHFAVALRYDSDKAGAPMLVAKGVDQMAQHIQTIARENDVPVIQSPALARSIYYTTEFEEIIPEQLFVAVAQILAYVFQLRAYNSGKGRKPKSLPTEMPIPEDIRY